VGQRTAIGYRNGRFVGVAVTTNRTSASGIRSFEPVRETIETFAPPSVRSKSIYPEFGIQITASRSVRTAREKRDVVTSFHGKHLRVTDWTVLVADFGRKGVGVRALNDLHAAFRFNTKANRFWALFSGYPSFGSLRTLFSTYYSPLSTKRIV